ncbi:chorismate synthase [Gloeobacter violaceus]|uniref:Chorismate synthase n=1 Tax=Gloeobacter violaceus (strain ATCC 29082 / PCC 7421) TaxID=251221 RepID=AROC_GLOVI|nr:chorismate synthase [Gloeobacter violaceus]Q7NFY1.1 RecName: Full=Chorismate synthase; Short=CS; AltName: Full=5-enolpyruvylshikimate-3-phosphate phospholyase [Gloeobacter violaceus PCC 7421]BAC91334.1 chorismate synthase [Gloeobacter violaceus PCC 7421]
MLRFLTAGESHGPGLTIIVEGIPADLPLLAEDIDRDLARRQVGFGRGGRMSIETDRVTFRGGVRLGRTIGSPIAMTLENRDFKNWEVPMSVSPVDLDDEAVRAQLEAKRITRLRPGHADYPGAVKYGLADVRNILERSSARETASRVAAGAIAKQLLRQFNVHVHSHVVEIGGVGAGESVRPALPTFEEWKDLFERVDQNDLRCHPDLYERLRSRVVEAAKGGYTLGGAVELAAYGEIPVGLGSHVHYDRRIDGLLAGAAMSVHTVKAVEVGIGTAAARETGADVQDEFINAAGEIARTSNHAGGIEGGMTNGQPVLLRAYLKPLPTMRKALRSIDLVSREPFEAHYERSDTCAVPAGGVVCEAMMAIVLAQELQRKLGGDSLGEMLRHAGRTHA